jgi:hypothetical protein
MLTINTEDTAPNKVLPDEGAAQTQPIETKPKARPRRWPFIVLGIFLVLLAGAIGAWRGYENAVVKRMTEQTSQVLVAASAQFQLGIDDFNSGRYEMARSRFEYVITLDPSYPGVAEKLAEVILKTSTTSTPTLSPTQTPIPMTPTPDLRPVEDLFNQALNQLNNKEWNNSINTLEALRKVDYIYRAVDADGIYYMALRFRGVDKILKEGNLEGGTYDLALAERFAPLDRDADSYRTWARFYVTGASFWGVDWEKVLFYFGQIYPALPNLRDPSNWTATERFRVGSIFFGDQLAQKGDWCAAQKQYENALALSPNNQLAPTATKVKELCSPDPTRVPRTATPTPTITGTLLHTISPTSGTPLPPSNTPTITKTQSPITNTPTPTPTPTIKPSGTPTK